MREITKYDDIIDSRDIIERIAELMDAGSAPDEGPNDDPELEALRALQEDAAHPDWEYGVSLIRDSYFRNYAEELADDIGAIDASANWPLDCIDWNKAANELKMDYTPLDFDGVTYWVR